MPKVSFVRINETRDVRESSFERDESSLDLKLVGDLGTFIDDFSELFLDFVDRHDFCELSQIDLLNFEEVEDVGESLESNEMTSDDVLLSFDVVAAAKLVNSTTIAAKRSTHLTTSRRMLPRRAMLSTTSRRARSPKLLPIRLGLTATIP